MRLIAINRLTSPRENMKWRDLNNRDWWTVISEITKTNFEYVKSKQGHIHFMLTSHCTRE